LERLEGLVVEAEELVCVSERVPAARLARSQLHRALEVARGGAREARGDVQRAPRLEERGAVVPVVDGLAQQRDGVLGRAGLLGQARALKRRACLGLGLDLEPAAEAVPEGEARALSGIERELELRAQLSLARPATTAENDAHGADRNDEGPEVDSP